MVSLDSARQFFCTTMLAGVTPLHSAGSSTGWNTTGGFTHMSGDWAGLVGMARAAGCAFLHMVSSLFLEWHDPQKMTVGAVMPCKAQALMPHIITSLAVCWSNQDKYPAWILVVGKLYLAEGLTFIYSHGSLCRNGGHSVDSLTHQVTHTLKHTYLQVCVAHSCDFYLNF